MLRLFAKSSEINSENPEVRASKPATQARVCGCESDGNNCWITIALFTQLEYNKLIKALYQCMQLNNELVFIEQTLSTFLAGDYETSNFRVVVKPGGHAVF